MKVITYPSKNDWSEILKRPTLNTENLFDTVRGIIDNVRIKGDDAVISYDLQFYKAALDSLQVTSQDIDEAVSFLDPTLQHAICFSKHHI